MRTSLIRISVLLIFCFLSSSSIPITSAVVSSASEVEVPQVSTQKSEQQKVKNNDETFNISLGNQTLVTLDPIRQVFERQISVRERVLVTFLITGIPTGVSTEVRLSTEEDLEIDNWEGQVFENGHRVTLLLTPQLYFLEIRKKLPEIRSREDYEIKEPLRSAVLTVSVEEVVKQVLPESLQAIEVWFRDIGLDKVIEVGEFVDTRNPVRGLPRSRVRFAMLDDKTQWVRSENVWFMVSFLQRSHQYDLTDTESAFSKTYHVGLWDRIFQKLSLMEGISARRIVAIVPGCQRVVFLDESNKVDRHGIPCNSQSASLPLMTRKLAKFRTATVKPPYRSLAEVVPTFFRSSLGESARLDFLTIESNFVEVIVRGLRGHVVSGGRDWEKLQLTLAVTAGEENSPDTLRVIIDGRVASGIGEYPQDTQFTRDMEPQYSENLTRYAKKIATAIRDRLTGK